MLILSSYTPRTVICNPYWKRRGSDETSFRRSVVECKLESAVGLSVGGFDSATISVTGCEEGAEVVVVPIASCAEAFAIKTRQNKAITALAKRMPKQKWQLEARL